MRLAAGVVVLLAAGLIPFSGRALAAAGGITEYTIPNVNAAPAGITTGPDVNIWFTEQAGNMVAKMTPSGVVTEYLVPTANSGPLGITAGPDGNLWFAEDTGNKVAKVTTSGAFTEFPVPTAGSHPSNIVAGPDGNLWFTENTGNNVTRVTTAGVFTEFPVPTGSGPMGIANGPDGNLWLTENAANNVARMTTAGAVTEFPVPTLNSGPQGIAAGPDGNLWFTENLANNVASVTISGLLTEYSIPTAASLPGDITLGPDGNLWFAESLGNNVASMTTSGDFTEYPLPIASSYPVGIASGPDGNLWSTENGGDVSANRVAKVHPPCPAATKVRSTQTASSTNQYRLQGSDGVTWQDVDAASLSISCSPTVNQAVLLTANADLFTGAVGYNQDLGIFVSVNGGSDQLLAWKESGGFAGIFSPNAAYIQSSFDMLAGQTYAFKLKWKTNRNAPGATIYAGAGAGPVSYSPTSLVAETFGTGAAPNFVNSTAQYTLPNSDGTTWQSMDDINLVTNVSPATNSTAVLGGNADLFTSNVGYNQDLGIFVSDNAGPDTLVAWKESGGFAGIFSPNAAFVKATYAMTGGHAYVFKLKWKTNKNAPGATIYAAAGASPGPYSHTSLVAETIATGANLYTASSVIQYSQTNSTGSTWKVVDPKLNVTVLPAANTNSIIGANVDLFTGAAGYNQDIGIFVSEDSGADSMLAWKESGGFAGTLSPNAAFSQATFEMTSGHTYVFKLKWKTNKDAPGATIYAAAGTGPIAWSNSTLTVEMTN